MTKKPAPKRPVGLAKTIDAEVRGKQKRLAAEAKADIALILRRRAEISEAFYDIGEALLRLRRPGVAEAMGTNNFGELCEARLDMSAARAYLLVEIVTRVSREDATRIGQERTRALLALCDATPEEDTPADLEHATVTLPSGAELVVPNASTRAILDAAKELRDHHGKGGRGRRVTRADRAKATAILRDLKGAEVDGAAVRVVAPAKGGSAHLVVRAPIDELAVIARILGRHAK